jgi:hypothetical protein
MPLVILQYLYSLQIKGDSNKKNSVYEENIPLAVTYFLH